MKTVLLWFEYLWPARRLAAIAALLLLSGVCAAGPAPDNLAALDDGKLQLASVHAAVAELDSGALLYAKDAHRSVPVASITKLMTAMVVLDSGAPQDEWLTIVERAKPPPNNGYSRIRIGSALQRKTLLKIMLMSSENLAAYNLAHYYPGGRSAFVAAMNAKAETLGMDDSHWAGPSGLSTQNRASAADVLKMLRAAYDYEAIREATRTGAYTAVFRKPRYRLRYGNTNPLVRYGDWDVRLSKTGYLDEAGRCLAMMVDIDGHRLAMVLLDSFGSRTPQGDAGRIARWVETGSGGSVAGPALAYERRKTEAYARADRGGAQTALASKD